MPDIFLMIIEYLRTRLVRFTPEFIMYKVES